jgi:hypothetical protein
VLSGGKGTSLVARLLGFQPLNPVAAIPGAGHGRGAIRIEGGAAGV